MDMTSGWRTINGAVLGFGLVLGLTGASVTAHAGAARARQPARGGTTLNLSSAGNGQTALSPYVAYIVNGHLRLRSLDSPTMRTIATPWPVTVERSGVSWSPDGASLVVSDVAHGIAVIDLATGHTTILGSLPATAYAWSPHARYLAFLKGATSAPDLWLWDRAQRGMRRMARNVTLSSWIDPSAPSPWSHDGAKLAVAIGHADYQAVRIVYPTLDIIDVIHGSIRPVGHGDEASWSPDDRLLSYQHITSAGVVQAYQDEMVAPVGGGAPIRLANYSDVFTDNEWAARPHGYIFDRWLLGHDGHIARQLVPDGERVDAWGPDGRQALVQSNAPYTQTPLHLSLVALTGVRAALYATGPTSGSGADSRALYTVAWGRSGAIVAFASPPVFSARHTATRPRLFVSAIRPGFGAGPPRAIVLPAATSVDRLDFAQGDRDLLILVDTGTYPNRKTRLYRYAVPSGAISLMASGITMFALQPMPQAP